MRIALAVLFLTATPLAWAHDHFRVLWILPNHHVRFDNGPELNTIQFHTELEKMKRNGGCPPIHIIPERIGNYATVGRVLMDMQRLGCHEIGFTGEEQYVQ